MRSAPLPAGRFFSIGVGVANPPVLFFGVGLDQARPRSLHRKVPPLKQMPHRPRVIADLKFLRDDLGDQGRSPHPGVQAVSDGAAVQDVRQVFPRAGVQRGGPPAALPFQQTFIALRIPSADPGVNPGAVDLQSLGDLAGGLPLNAEHDGLEPQGDAGRWVGVGFLAQRLEPWERARIAACEDGLHGQKGYAVLLLRDQLHHDAAQAGKQKEPLPSGKPFLRIHSVQC